MNVCYLVWNFVDFLPPRVLESPGSLEEKCAVTEVWLACRVLELQKKWKPYLQRS